MKTINYLTIKQKLIFSFFFSLVFFLGFSMVSLYAINQIGTLLNSIYYYPMVVSNASFELRGDILKLHRDVNDLILASDESLRQKSLKQIDSDEKAVYNSLDAIKGNILGEQGIELEKETRAMFDEYCGTLNQIVTLSE